MDAKRLKELGGIVTESRSPKIVVDGMPEKFWVVSRPSPDSTLDDIVFETDYYGFSLQAIGGLDIDEIVAIYANGNKAKAHGKKLLNDKKDM